MPKCNTCEFMNDGATWTSCGMEYDPYCEAGIPEEATVEFKGGEYGCRHHKKTLQRMKDKAEQAYADYIGQMGMEMGFTMDVEERPEVKEKSIALMEHALGYDNSSVSPYKRHGKLFYKPYRNYYAGNAEDERIFDTLTFYGLAKVIRESKWGKTYAVTEKGRDWLGKQIGVKIWEKD